MIIVFKYRWRLSLTSTPQTKTKSDFIRFRKHWSLGLNFIHTHRVRDGAWDLMHPLNTLYPLSCPPLPRFDCLQSHMFWASALWARPFAGPCHVPPAVLKHWHLRETEAQKRKDMENLEGLTTVCRPYCALMLQPVWPPTDREEQKKKDPEEPECRNQGENTFAWMNAARAFCWHSPGDVSSFVPTSVETTHWAGNGGLVRSGKRSDTGQAEVSPRWGLGWG